MTKILTLAIAFALLQCTATAQTQRTDANGAKGKKSAMHKGTTLENVEGLNLTDEQKKQIAAIKQDSKTKAKAIKAGTLSEEEKKKEMNEIKMASKSKVEDILTTSQKDLLKAKKAEAKKADKLGVNKKGKIDGKMDDNRKEKMKDKFENMPAETRAKLKAIREDQTLTKEQKKEAVRKIMMENKADKSDARSTKS